MEKTLKELIEGLLNTLDPSNEVVTESIRENITTKFIEAVKAAVESEKEKFDEAVAGQMEILNDQITSIKEQHEKEKQDLIDEGVEAVSKIDEKFTELLEFTVEQFDNRAVSKLEECKEAFDNALDGEIEDLCESVETIIESKLEEQVSDEELVSKAKLEKLVSAFESIREIVLKDAILDEKVNEAIGSMKEDYEKLLSQNITMSKKLNKQEVDTYLESETEGLKPALKDYLIERFENANIKDVKEKWESAIEDFKKLEEENRRLSKGSLEELDIDKKIAEDLEKDEEKDISESEKYYHNMADQYSRFF